MSNRIVVAIATAALLSELVTKALAHGDDHMDMNVQDAPQIHESGAPGSYWGLSEHATLMYFHIALEMLAWVVILPIAVALSIARSRYTLPSQLIFLATNALALVLGVVYNHKTPELYANNSHSKTGWIITWITSAWVCMAVVQIYAGRSTSSSSNGEAAHPMTIANMARYERVHDDLTDPSRYSNDSGQGTERNSSSLFGHSRSPSVESEEQQFAGPTRSYVEEDSSYDKTSEKHGLLRNASVERFLSRHAARFAPVCAKTIRLLYVVFERTILVQGLVAIASGTVVYGGIGRGDAVFNVLAHFVKGSIFFLYGLLTLGRWMGAFADFGWAWNVKPPKEIVGRRRAALPTAEFVESFVIWLYGVSDVFLEHLAAWGDEWTAEDLEHVSIPVMFFGGGLMGMIIESARVRDLLNSTIISSQTRPTSHSESWQQPRQYRISMNPLPALMMLLLGKMMSSHHQTSMLSTMIHSQWGGMFMGFALARGLTYITLYISPPTSFLPSRPPTELITSFCLIAGGITFMLSNKDTVAVLEGYNLDAMFTFTVTMGLTALLMAWSTVVIAIKGWAFQNEGRNQYAKSHVGVLA